MAIALNVSNSLDSLSAGQSTHLLNHWPQLMLEDIWHFNQAAGAGAPLQTANDKAGGVYLQKEREYIARNLETAFTTMSGDLNYTPCPLYFSELIPLGSGSPLQFQYFQARWAKMIELGKRAQTLIQAGVAVVYSDPNSVGVNDTATITLNTTVANAEIALYFQVADGCPTAGDYRYEIEPLQVTSAAGVVTIVAHRALFVSPKQWAREYVANDPNFNSPNIVDTANASTGFVTAVDIYRVYTDTSANIELIGSDGSTVLQTFTGEIQDAGLSTFRMGDLCGSFCWDQSPKSIRVNYKAGSPLINGNVDGELYEAVVAFACGNMMSRLTHMANWSLDLWNKYHDPMVQSIGGNLIPVATKMQSSSQYGARYGQAFAWGVVIDRRVFKAHKLTYNMRH